MSIGYSIYRHIPFGFLKNKILNNLKRNKAGSTSSLLREIFKNDYGISIGYGSYGGCFNPANIPSGVSFGNYCSIADGVKIFRANHPLDNFTSHPLFYNPVMGFVCHDKLRRPDLHIGNDVWIGANAIILPSVRRIGNGAVVGAGSVVTKDVDSYSIVVGNPAKEIKKRFSNQKIEYLESREWWEMDYITLSREFESIQSELQSRE